MTTVLALQRALAAHGFDPGPLDGVLGRKTTMAIAAFQADKKLDIQHPGTIGPKTLAALGLPVHVGRAPVPWIDEARRYLGLHEHRDAKKLDAALRLNSRQIPWCGGFVGLVITSTLPGEALPENPLWARNWLKFGRSLDKPHAGAVAVFSRGPTSGHVGFVVGHDRTHLHLLGGNQSDRVSIVRIAKNRLLGYRWPSTMDLPGGELRESTIQASVSTNEA